MILQYSRGPFESHNPVAGSAAYLARINPLAVGVLRNRWRRWHSAWHATDGIFEEIEPQLALKTRRLTEKAYSPTALQQFAMCPYRSHLDSILMLKPLAEASAAQRMDPRTRGSIFHRVQERMMRELTLPAEDLHAAYEALHEAMRAIAAEEAAVKHSQFHAYGNRNWNVFMRIYGLACRVCPNREGLATCGDRAKLRDDRVWPLQDFGRD